MKQPVIVYSLAIIIVLTLGITISISPTLYAVSETTEAEELPKVGSEYVWQKAHYIVRGVGKAPFEYIATGESLVLRIMPIPGAMVFIPKKGEKVRVDPSIPMVWVNGKEKNEFKNNCYIKKNGKHVDYMLLEYDRSK